jgi:hypothetical protein
MRVLALALVLLMSSCGDDAGGDYAGDWLLVDAEGYDSQGCLTAAGLVAWPTMLSLRGDGACTVYLSNGRAVATSWSETEGGVELAKGATYESRGSTWTITALMLLGEGLINPQREQEFFGDEAHDRARVIWEMDGPSTCDRGLLLHRRPH